MSPSSRRTKTWLFRFFLDFLHKAGCHGTTSLQNCMCSGVCGVGPNPPSEWGQAHAAAREGRGALDHFSDTDTAKYFFPAFHHVSMQIYVYFFPPTFFRRVLTGLHDSLPRRSRVGGDGRRRASRVLPPFAGARNHPVRRRLGLARTVLAFTFAQERLHGRFHLNSQI